MTQFASGAWAEGWAGLKKEFEKNTGKKKPSQKVMGVFKKPSGVESAMKDADKAFNAFNGEKDAKKKEQAGKLFKEQVAKAKVAGANYLKVLDAAVKGDKEADSDYAKGVQMLSAAVDALLSSMDNQAAKVDGVLQGQSVKQQMAATFYESTDAAVKRAILFAKRVAANPTAEVFNKDIKDAARDITQNIGNIPKLKGLGYEFPAGDPTNLFKILDPWANNKRDQKPGADANTVKREIGAFLQAVNGVATWLKKK